MEINLEKYFGENVSFFISLVGLYAFVCWSYDNFKSLFQIIFSTVNPNKNETLIKRYGKWAVITGSTDGIGFEYAKELARKGLNIVLISRTESKLLKCANEIESTYGVKTKIIVADFGNGREIYNRIENDLKNIDIGILVNNVGMMYNHPDDLENQPVEDLWNIINVNVGAVTMMCRMMIPQMKERNRGIIVNVSSGTQNQPLPLMTVYAATKTYTKYFTLALIKELKESNSNIEVQLLAPMFVRTKMVDFSSSTKSRWNFFTADADTYAKWSVSTLGKTQQTNGYWSHGLQNGFLGILPERLRVIIGYYLNLQFRKEYFSLSMQREK